MEVLRRRIGETMRKLNQLLFVTVIVFSVAAVWSTKALAQDGDKKPGSKLSVKYDKKTDLTTVKLKAFRISPLILEKEANNNTPLHQTDVEISYTYAGRQASKPVESVTFRFKVTSGNYIFLRSQTAMAVLDNTGGQGRAFALGESDYKSFPPITNSIYEEALVVNAPADALVKMAKAKSLQLYLGPVSYTVPEKQLEGIKELAASLPPASSAKSYPPRYVTMK